MQMKKKKKATTKKRIAKEKQNQVQVEIYDKRGAVGFGPWTSFIWRHDPRHLGFLLARYKFAAKMLAGKKRVLEIGCGDGAGLPVILQTVKSVHGVDFEPLVLDDLRARAKREGLKSCSFAVHDLLKGPVPGQFDAAYSLDVIEHIPPKQESKFMTNICRSLTKDAVLIMGTPNITASAYASKASQEGHINLKSADTLKATLSKFFTNVFVFSMNDEVVHTGYSPMAHYLIVMGVGKKR